MNCIADNMPLIIQSKTIASLLFYMLCSTSMAFINKAVISVYEFNYPLFLMACQMLCSALAVESLRFADVIHIQGFTMDKGRMFLLPSFCYTTNAVLSLVALSGMNIPVYGVIKRLAPIISLFLTVFLLKKPWPNKIIIFAILMLVFGCVISAIGDVTSSSMRAYIACGISVFAQALYQILVQRCAENNLTSTEILLLNSYNTFPFLLLLSLSTGEMNDVLAFKQWAMGDFLFMFLLITTTGSILNYSLFLCTSLNSALTTSLVGPIKSSLQTFIGLYTFGGVTLNIFTAVGITTSLSGGFLYVYGKVSEMRGRSSSLPTKMLPVQSNLVTTLAQEEVKSARIQSQSDADINACFMHQNGKTTHGL